MGGGREEQARGRTPPSAACCGGGAAGALSSHGMKSQGLAFSCLISEEVGRALLAGPGK